MIEIITGYTGTRHITPKMDAAVWRSIFNYERNGIYTNQFYVLYYGDQFRTTMNSANEALVRNGLLSMQGYLAIGSDTLLTIDSCPSGYSRVDLIVCRFTHDPDTTIDAMEIAVLKGIEVQNPNTPPVPHPASGRIDDGATIVEMPLYEVHMNGSTVTLNDRRVLLPNVSDGNVIRVKMGPVSSLPYSYVNQYITAKHVVVESVLSNPSAQTGDWTVTTQDKSLKVEGSISGTTYITLTIVKGMFLYTDD